ncbi:MAG: hypothetical protein MUD01_11480 [Chloroflexaceae bacterium]|nr:hypothetical protein [Chloroflexaceae bacterium]
MTSSYQYNGWGDKVQQTVGGQTSTFTLDIGTVLTEVLAVEQGGSTIHMLPGLGEASNGDWRYYHTDPLGSVRLLSNGTGQITNRFSYTPFGAPEAPPTPLPFASFTGEPTEAATGLLYLRARHYHPALGLALFLGLGSASRAQGTALPMNTQVHQKLKGAGLLLALSP